jgi:hypothetical protein
MHSSLLAGCAIVKSLSADDLVVGAKAKERLTHAPDAADAVFYTVVVE